MVESPPTRHSSSVASTRCLTVDCGGSVDYISSPRAHASASSPTHVMSRTEIGRPASHRPDAQQSKWPRKDAPPRSWGPRAPGRSTLESEREHPHRRPAVHPTGGGRSTTTLLRSGLQGYTRPDTPPTSSPRSIERDDPAPSVAAFVRLDGVAFVDSIVSGETSRCSLPLA